MRKEMIVVLTLTACGGDPTPYTPVKVLPHQQIQEQPIQVFEFPASAPASSPAASAPTKEVLPPLGITFKKP